MVKFVCNRNAKKYLYLWKLSEMTLLLSSPIVALFLSNVRLSKRAAAENAKIHEVQVVVVGPILKNNPRASKQQQ